MWLDIILQGKLSSPDQIYNCNVNWSQESFHIPKALL